jgi:predicted transglutaminase-like protease
LRAKEELVRMKKAEAIYNAANQSNSNRDYKEKYLDMREINKDLKSHFR